MWRARLTTTLLVLLLPALARGGALSEVSEGLKEKSDNDTPAGGGSSDDSDGDGWGNVVGAVLDGLFGGGGSSSSEPDPDNTNLGIYIERGVGGPTGGDTSSQFYLGVQSVKDSDGSFTAEARAWYRDFGLGVRGTSFFEERETGDRGDLLRIDTWTVGPSYRVAHGENFAAWLELGLSGLDNDGQMSLLGVTGGLVLERDLPGSFGFRGAVRRTFYQDDIHANEFVAGISIEFLQASYRYVDFDVGPPLQGPEVGLLLTF